MTQRKMLHYIIFGLWSIDFFFFPTTTNETEKMFLYHFVPRVWDLTKTIASVVQNIEWKHLNVTVGLWGFWD